MKPVSPVPGVEAMLVEEDEEEVVVTPAARVIASLVG